MTILKVSFQKKGFQKKLINHICISIKKVNDYIRNDVNLGEGYQIGHSYFCNYDSTKQDENSWWNDILDFELQPLLEEIWFDELDKVSDMLKTLMR
jgi:5-methylcytosine-specific restriction enzyme B